MAPQIRAVLFDFDGTLADTTGSLRIAYAAFLERLGITGGSPFERWEGTPLHAVVATTVEEHGIPDDPRTLLQEYTRTLTDTYVREARLAEGAAALLRWCAGNGIAAAIVTSASRTTMLPIAERISEIRGLPLITSEDAPSSKPHPAPYSSALSRLGLSADQAIAIEDSEAGVRSASVAGLCCIGLTSDAAKRASLRRAGARVVVRDLHEASEVCRAIVSGCGRILPVPEFHILVSKPTTPTAEIDAAVAADWNRRKVERPGLHDSVMFSAADWSPDGQVILEPTSYRYFLAQRGGIVTGIIGVGVTGVTLANGKIVLAKRAETVTQYPSHWELPPSGGVTSEDSESDLCRELQEELEVAPGTRIDVRPLALVEDLKDGVLDMAYVVQLGCESVRLKNEYSELAMLPPDQAISFLRREKSVPHCVALIELALERISVADGTNPG